MPDQRPTPDSPEDLADRFTYHPPKPGQPDTYQRLRGLAHDFAAAVVDAAPASRERSLALTKIEEAVMWANASIARHGD